MSIFSDCMGIGYAAIEDTAGQSVVYRDQFGDIPVIAVPEDDASTEENVAGSARSTVREQAWLIRASSLVRGATQIIPRHGHRIELADGTLFQVQAPQLNVTWEWSSGFRTHYRIFTVEIKATS